MIYVRPPVSKTRMFLRQ